MLIPLLFEKKFQGNNSQIHIWTEPFCHNVQISKNNLESAIFHCFIWCVENNEIAKCKKTSKNKHGLYATYRYTQKMLASMQCIILVFTNCWKMVLANFLEQISLNKFLSLEITASFWITMFHILNCTHIEKTGYLNMLPSQ